MTCLGLAILLLLLFSSSTAAASSNNNPTADPSAVVLSGPCARFTVLTAGMVRMERGLPPFDDRATFAVVNRRLSPVAAFRVTRHGESGTDNTTTATVITTAMLELTHTYTSADAPSDASSDASAPACAGPFAPSELRIRLLVAPFTTWSPPAPPAPPDAPTAGHPGSSVAYIGQDPMGLNLNGTMNYGPSFAGGLDCYSSPPLCEAAYRQSIGQGLLSRAGFAVVNDTNATRFASGAGRRGSGGGGDGGDGGGGGGDSDVDGGGGGSSSGGGSLDSGSSDGGGSGGFPWFDPSSTREANHRVSEDLYMLVSGLDYTGALGAWARVGGAPSLPPLAALGVWYSRYYPYGAASYQKDVLGEYAANGLPLSVGVLDVPWHNIDYAIADLGPDKNGSWPYPDVPGTAAPDAACNGWDGFTFNRTLFPDPAGFFEGVHAQGIKMILSVHMQNGIDHCQDQYLAMARAVGMSPEDIARNTTVACAMDDRKF